MLLRAAGNAVRNPSSLNHRVVMGQFGGPTLDYFRFGDDTLRNLIIHFPQPRFGRPSGLPWPYVPGESDTSVRKHTLLDSNQQLTILALGRVDRAEFSVALDWIAQRKREARCDRPHFVLNHNVDFPNLKLLGRRKCNPVLLTARRRDRAYQRLRRCTDLANVVCLVPTRKHQFAVPTTSAVLNAEWKVFVRDARMVSVAMTTLPCGSTAAFIREALAIFLQEAEG